MNAFLLNQSEFTGVAFKETLRSVLLYVKIHDQSIIIDFKNVLSGWTSRDVDITSRGIAGAVRNH
jgi:hypothetical protein